MSWMTCKCENILYDNTDNISYKGYIISDKEYFNMYDLADEMIESKNPDREEVAMAFRRNIGGNNSYIKLKEIFQCPVCGRILIEDTAGNFCVFFPEKECNKNILDYGVNGEIMHIHRKQ